jgi:polyisoprenyl-phosphate glycosyltransferase
MRLSIVTPAYNEADSLPALYQRLSAAASAVAGDWEWVIVDDHSRDATFAVIDELAARDPRVRGLRLARNSGSHVAITCGLHHVSGDAAVMMAGDLQDPPETLSAMLDRWRRGAQVVWAVRRTRPGERHHTMFAALYYWIMRRIVGMTEMPERGADFFLVDRVVIDAFRHYQERNVSVLALIMSLGFRQEFIEYDKQPRVAGRSGWTLAKKVKLVIDSVTAFSSFPIRLCSLAGLVLVALTAPVGLAGLLLLPGVGGGLLLIVALVLGLAGMQMVALGVMGEYVFRALEEARRRPPWLIERGTGRMTASGSAEKLRVE